jgi:hypothetical protein
MFRAMIDAEAASWTQCQNLSAIHISLGPASELKSIKPSDFSYFPLQFITISQGIETLTGHRYRSAKH